MTSLEQAHVTLTKAYLNRSVLETVCGLCLSNDVQKGGGSVRVQDELLRNALFVNSLHFRDLLVLHSVGINKLNIRNCLYPALN